MWSFLSFRRWGKNCIFLILRRISTEKKQVYVHILCCTCSQILAIPCVCLFLTRCSFLMHMQLQSKTSQSHVAGSGKWCKLAVNCCCLTLRCFYKYCKVSKSCVDNFLYFAVLVHFDHLFILTFYYIILYFILLSHSVFLALFVCYYLFICFQASSLEKQKWKFRWGERLESNRTPLILISNAK